MPVRSLHRRTDPDPMPIIDFGVPHMFDLQTELHLRRDGRDGVGHAESRAAQAILIVANLSALSLLVVVLL